MKSSISGSIDLSEIPQDLLDPTLELRAAVVFEATVLGSTVLKAGSPKEPLRFSVDFEAPILPGARLPCPVRLVIGPNLVDRELLSIDAVSIDVDLTGRANNQAGKKEAKGAAPKEPGLQPSVGNIRIDIEMYRCWILCCRLYTIRGRVVCRQWQYDPAIGRYRFCDAPVPGATVEAYDVDHWFIWYHRDLIKTAVTDIAGNFVIQFRWCCLRWYPWLVRNWAIDPDVFTRVAEVIAKAGLRLPPRPPGPDPDPLFLQEIVSQAGLLPGGRWVDVPAGLGEPVSAESLLRLLPPSAELAALHIWPWWDQRDCAPDVVFRVTQLCGNQLRVIHTETNAQTRWNIPTTLGVTLLANSQACCLPVCRDPECPECLKVTYVGCTRTDLIGATSGPPDLRGYGNVPAVADQPFFGDLRIRGAVGADVDYFKVQYSRNGAPFADLPMPAFGGFPRAYWDGAGAVDAPPPAFTPILKGGQTVMITRHHYEELHPGIPRFGGSVIWFDFDTLFHFNTLPNPALTPDGLYELRFVGYSADAADNLMPGSERILPTCGQAHTESVFIRIDNRVFTHPAPTPLHPCGAGFIHDCTVEPDCYIRQICINEGTPGAHCISACDIVRLAASDKLTIHYSVTCPPTVEDGHLGGYWMRAEFGVSEVFYIGTGAHGTFAPDPTFEVGPDYASALAQGAPRPHWYGGDYKVTLTGADFEKCCAYIVRLRAWKRTTDGCTDPQWVHANEFEIAFTVLRKELCPDICKDQQ